MENNGDRGSEESWPWMTSLENLRETFQQIPQTEFQPLMSTQIGEQTLLITGESQPLSPEQFGESQPPQSKAGNRKKIAGGSSMAERSARKRGNDQQYRRRRKLEQEEVKIEKEKLALANKQLESEIGRLKGEIQEKDQEIEQLKKEIQEKEQRWKSDLEKCVDGFGRLKQEAQEKEQLLTHMKDKEKRSKLELEKMEAEFNDKLLNSRSYSCSCGHQCKPDAIESENLQIKSELAQIPNERDNRKEQETVFKKILTGMDAKIRFYCERKEAGWISFGKNVLEATVTLFCTRRGTSLPEPINISKKSTINWLDKGFLYRKSNVSCLL